MSYYKKAERDGRQAQYRREGYQSEGDYLWAKHKGKPTNKVGDITKDVGKQGRDGFRCQEERGG